MKNALIRLKWKYCPECGTKLQPIIDTDINSKKICKNEFCKNNKLHLIKQLTDLVTECGALFKFDIMKEKQKNFTEDQIKEFVIKLRKKHRIVQKIIYDMERDFELGFVWDKSLD